MYTFGGFSDVLRLILVCKIYRNKAFVSIFGSVFFVLGPCNNQKNQNKKSAIGLCTILLMLNIAHGCLIFSVHSHFLHSLHHIP